MTDWRTLEAKLIYILRLEGCDIEEDELCDQQVVYDSGLNRYPVVNLTALAKALADNPQGA